MRDEKIQIRTATEALNEKKNKLKLSTGYEDLNDLTGGIEEGAFNLFYGDQEILSDLAYRLLVNCIIPKEKGGFEAKGLYFNNTNYYTGKTILNPSKISRLAKHIRVDPWLVFDKWLAFVQTHLLRFSLEFINIFIFAVHWIVNGIKR